MNTEIKMVGYAEDDRAMEMEKVTEKRDNCVPPSHC